jgi:hypothetical protein
MAQFNCPFCGEGFEQKSRYERHLAEAHPAPAVTAADLETTLAGIAFPADKRALVAHAAHRLPADAEVLRALEALPERTYRDAAEVAIAFGESKAGGTPRTARAVAAEEPPSRRGGRAAATEAVSAAAVAKALGGIDFPKSKAQLVAYAARVATGEEIVRLLERLPERRYADMAELFRALPRETSAAGPRDIEL